MEIIEFPSVLLKYDHKTRQITRISEIQHYCKPKENWRVSEFCTELTGITQETVNGGIPLPDALKKHKEWLAKHVPNFYQGGHKNVYMMTVGCWDLAEQLPKDMKRWNKYDKKMSFKSLHSVYKRFINIKDEYVYFMKPKSKRGWGMKAMLRGLGIELKGRHHSGIDDCRNTASIFEELVRRGMNPLYMRELYAEAYNGL